MDLLAISDPVFVVDLTPATMEACRADFFAPPSPGQPPPTPHPPAPPQLPIRAVALVLCWESDPLLLPIEPTRDTEALDAAARLLRAALLTGRSAAELVQEAGDQQLRHLYFARKLPRFIYTGLPASVRQALGIPAAITHAAAAVRTAGPRRPAAPPQRPGPGSGRRPSG